MSGVKKLTEKFAELKEKGEKALVTYVTAGDPNLETTARLVCAMEQAGADVIELGVPFSDPVADGPVIQRASTRSLQGGTHLTGILEMVRGIREKVQAPLVLMSYYNPILQYGLEKFCQDAVRCGIAGLIVPDLPLEEAGPLLHSSQEAGLAYIPLVAPTSPQRRLARIAESGQGFIYCVTVTGITGTKQNVSNEIARMSGEIREVTDLPLAAGFGIAAPEQAKAVAPYCDAVVVGSALVKLVENHREDSLEPVASLTAQLKQALLRL
ncbi:tryptophan synthase subunit alpha [Desulforamulus ruminis]|uniref:Tryptophan synthase alpha chain n=1 Tax=Desulforamulus ruminis (strain ATCC 23193 / DSM 2154 / NCIMB 8452 / DL) TaxID=696281 RepID=F6DPR1_DESRL|nr:tryptophan synthase subunit alpha [Desulforamulus ruminis]AEG59638.1 tryptophan synthase, alpha subunit [Desulforamulus ruminis DSM 2154]